MIDFPSSPAIGQSFTSGTGGVYTWDGVAWNLTGVGFDKWSLRGIGEWYFADTSRAGVEIPPQSNALSTWIELTAGLTGVGAFNNGKLTSESVSGSTPLVIATAVISLAGSPMNGQTVDLLNTESRIIRPSTSPGTKQNDALQEVTGYFELRKMSDGTAMYVGTNGAFSNNPSAGGAAPRNGAAPGAALSSDAINFALSGGPGARTAVETRMKNLGVKAYMRIK